MVLLDSDDMVLLASEDMEMVLLMTWCFKKQECVLFCGKIIFIFVSCVLFIFSP